MEKNILVTTLSITTGNKANIYYRNDKYCLGVLSMEPGSIYILSEYPIDKIVAIGTNEIIERKPDSGSDLTWFDKYKTSIESFLQQKGFEDYIDKVDEGLKREKVNEIFPDKMMVPNSGNANKEIEICFVNEQQENGDYNIKEIVDALYGDDEKKEINLYIDVQGGNRTSGYVRNAALSILCNQHPDRIHIKEMVATNYNQQNVENEIVDEYDRYRILDLVSGMNAFIQYGKADMIKSYCDAQGAKIGKNSNIAELVQYMVKIDNAISLCNMTELTNTIKNLKRLFDKIEEKNSKEVNGFVDNIFDILHDGIKRDYGKLVESDDFDNLELISWCRRKGFIQQALTLIEDKMPEVYYNNNIFSYDFVCNEDKKRKFLKNLGQGYEKEINKIFYSLEKTTEDGQANSRDEIIDMLHTINEEMEMCTPNDIRELEEKCIVRREVKPIVKYSILKCCGIGRQFVIKNEYWKNGEKKTDIKAEAEMNVKVNIIEEDQKLLKLVFFLHKLLKQERNACNHASEDDNRLSADLVKGLIKLYVEKADEIMKIAI